MIYLGVDLGGTNIKAAAVMEDGRILSETFLPTMLPRSAEAVTEDIVNAMGQSLEKIGAVWADVAGAGVGCPGTVDDESGMILYSNNLGWAHFAMRAFLKERTGISVRLANDANAAALGESIAGCAQGAHSAVVLTLGTGVGSGVVLNGKMLSGYTGAASELGHMVILADGEMCTCGRRGCLESYASASALIRMTREAMTAYPKSILHELAKREGGISGKTVFLAKELGDAAGTWTVERYIHFLSIGVANVVNIFFPEIVALSGGVANQGDRLLEPLRQEVWPQVFGRVRPERRVRIECCTLGYKAGVIGAALMSRG